MKSYWKEIAVLNKLEEYKKQKMSLAYECDKKSDNKSSNSQNSFLKAQFKNEPSYAGFPEVVSRLHNYTQAEILMEALGSNLRKLLKQCPGKCFSSTTVYMITIQLVSIFQIVSLINSFFLNRSGEFVFYMNQATFTMTSNLTTFLQATKILRKYI